MGKKHAKVDWKKAQRLYERDGKTFSEIAAHFGCKPHTVGIHARNEGWVNRRQIAKETAAERRELISRQFVERQAAAILQDMEEQHLLVRKLRTLTDRHADRLLEDRLWQMQRGEVVVDEDPASTLDKLTRAAERCEKINRSLAGLNDAGWRSSGERGEADTGPHAARVRQALAELETGRPDSGRDGPEGEVED